MRITVKRVNSQLLLFACVAVFAAIAAASCGGRKDDNPVIPPETSPLSRDYIGFAVITASFTHIVAAPEENSNSIGYLRRGSLVRVMKRQAVKTGNTFVSWVLIDGEQQGGPQGAPQGWLKEEVMDIYDNESQAKTASDAMTGN
jgi:hypothetical protein